MSDEEDPRTMLRNSELMRGQDLVANYIPILFKRLDEEAKYLAFLYAKEILDVFQEKDRLVRHTLDECDDFKEQVSSVIIQAVLETRGTEGLARKATAHEVGVGWALYLSDVAIGFHAVDTFIPTLGYSVDVAG